MQDQRLKYSFTSAKLPTLNSERANVIAFRFEGEAGEHLAVLYDGWDRHDFVPLRIHSSCVTGESLGSLKCDCREQLEQVKHEFGQSGGVIIYLFQEGRGIGIFNKIAAYAKQDEGLNTNEANRALGFQDDEREYDVALEMCRHLDIKRVKLYSNNPEKIRALTDGGVEVTEQPTVFARNAHNANYLRTKRIENGHRFKRR
jgi:GTP cyclohydrolase II